MPAAGTFYKPEMHPTGVLGFCAQPGQQHGMLPNNVATLRKAKRLSQTTLAHAIGTTLSQMGKLERGERPLTADWIEKIAEVLEVEPFRIIAPARLFPTEEQLADMLLFSQQRLPAGLPYSEWPRAVAAELRTRLLTLADDRASADSADA